MSVESEFPLEISFFEAARLGNVKKLDQLLSEGVDINWQTAPFFKTVIHLLADDGNTSSLKHLLSKGPNLELLDHNQMTPLMVACSWHGKKRATNAALIIDAGANVNAVRASDEMTPLKYSALRAEIWLVEKLIDAGAQVDYPPNSRQTALMLAARENNAAAVDLLVRKGADPLAPCGLPWAQGKTAEELAQLERARKALAAFKLLRTQGVIH